MKKPRKSLPEVISVKNPDYSSVAAAVIGSGGIAAVPTETYYGLAADPYNEEAVKRLYKIKKRAEDKPILLLIDNAERLSSIVTVIPQQYEKLIRDYWPGGLTLIFPAKPNLPETLTGGTNTVGIRISSNTDTTAICKACQGPITATSANISGKPPASSAEEILEYFSGDIDLVVDGGESYTRKGSTVVSLSGNNIRIVREGVVELS